jgi:hypothetical protein
MTHITDDVIEQSILNLLVRMMSQVPRLRVPVTFLPSYPLLVLKQQVGA